MSSFSGLINSYFLIEIKYFTSYYKKKYVLKLEKSNQNLNKQCCLNK